MQVPESGEAKLGLELGSRGKRSRARKYIRKKRKIMKEHWFSGEGAGGTLVTHDVHGTGGKGGGWVLSSGARLKRGGEPILLIGEDDSKTNGGGRGEKVA